MNNKQTLLPKPKSNPAILIGIIIIVIILFIIMFGFVFWYLISDNYQFKHNKQPKSGDVYKILNNKSLDETKSICSNDTTCDGFVFIDNDGETISKFMKNTTDKSTSPLNNESTLSGYYYK